MFGMDDGPNIRDIVANELAGKLCAALGYKFAVERTQRIAEQMDKLVQEGWGGPASFAEALEIELLLYGDPDAPAQHFTPMRVGCFICGGDSNRTCRCHDGRGATCDMICNPTK